jgi:hypothetical protein
LSLKWRELYGRAGESGWLVPRAAVIIGVVGVNGMEEVKG